MKTFKTLSAALHQYLGRRQGQNMREFMNEANSLSAADKAWYKAELLKVDILVEDSTPEAIAA